MTEGLCDFGSVKSFANLSANQFPYEMEWDQDTERWIFFEWFILAFGRLCELFYSTSSESINFLNSFKYVYPFAYYWEEKRIL